MAKNGRLSLDMLNFLWEYIIDTVVNVGKTLTADRK